jgi:predicted nucleotide-binding protein (sugar kinase/HSP70/actin superfamily)
MGEILNEARNYLPLDFSGESVLTVGRTILFARQGAKMVINCAPFGCMPGTISTGIFGELQAKLGIPIVNQFYDGEGDLNKKIGTYLANISPEREEYHSPAKKQIEKMKRGPKENRILVTPLDV